MNNLLVRPGRYMNNLLLRPGTEKTYHSLRKRWILPISGMKHSNAFLEERVVWWLNSVRLSPRTVKILVRLLCEEANKYGSNLDPKPITRQIMKRVQNKEIKALTKEQSKFLIYSCLPTRLYLPVLLALHTGMRRGEIWGLEWENVNFEKRRIFVSNSYGGPTKNGKNRFIPMSEEVFASLSAINANPVSGSHVIREPFDPNPGLKAICKKIHIPIVNFHSLRHTFATLALEAGISPRKVQEVLGHSSLSTTLNIYWSSTQEKMNLDFLK